MTARATPGDTLLTVLRRGGDHRLADLAGAVDRSTKKTQESLARLIRRDLVERVDRGLYRIAAAGEPETVTLCGGRSGVMRRPRDPDSLRARAWRVLRMRQGKASIPDLVRLAANPGDSNPTQNLAHYFRFLERAGILKRLPRRATGSNLTSSGHIVWLLVRDPGPLAPVARIRHAVIHDPNSGKDHPIPPLPEKSP